MSWQGKTIAFACRWTGHVWYYETPHPREPELQPATLQLLMELYLLPFRLYVIAWLWAAALEVYVWATLLYPFWWAARALVRATTPARRVTAEGAGPVV
jgi:hypothetical protein